MLCQVPISYAAHLFPNKVNHTVPHKPNLTNGVSVALRNVEFEPPFMMTYDDIRVPTSKASQILIEEQDKELALQKLQLLQRGSETDELIRDYFHSKKKDQGEQRRREYEKTVRDHLLQQGVGNGMSDTQVRELVDQQLVQKAVTNAANHTPVEPTAEDAVDINAIKGTQGFSSPLPALTKEPATPPTPLQNDTRIDWGNSWHNGSLSFGGNWAIPTADYLFTASSSVRRATNMWGSSTSPAAEKRGMVNRADDDELAPTSALGYTAATTRAAVNMAPARVSKPIEESANMKKATDHYNRTLFNKSIDGLREHAFSMRDLRDTAEGLKSEDLFVKAKAAGFKGGKAKKSIMAKAVAFGIDRGVLSPSVLHGPAGNKLRRRGLNIDKTEV